MGQRGYRTVTSRAELGRLGFSEPQRCVPALLIPLWGVHGEPVGYQIRPDQPRQGKDGKLVKYETPAKSQMVLDVPPSARPLLGDPSKPLFITEGVKKADSAATRGLCCIALLGVWNWRGKNDLGGLVALPEWDSIALNRTVYIVFDSDVVTKSGVHQAMSRLKGYIEHRKATVKVVYLPSEEAGGKVGMDDYFFAGHSVDELISHAVDGVRPLEVEPHSSEPPYKITPEGIFQRGEPGWLALTNFSARIVADVTHDDGVEERRSFRIEGERQGRTTVFDVPAADFGDLAWVETQLGAGATLHAIRGVEKHVRAAIQLESGTTAPRMRVFGHTGWARYMDSDVYLHANGAIGELGVVNGVEVKLPTELARFSLPPPPVGEARNRAIASALRLIDIAPTHIAAPLLAAPLRVVLGPCDFAVHLAGATGVFKTAIAALAQQFFGAGFDGRSLPASWLSTENAIETLAFLAKDALLGVDDFAPSAGVDGLRKMQVVSDRVFRGQGNAAGRARCATDGSLRKTRYPRGLILSSGEDLPRGASIRARLLTVFVAAGDVDVVRLTEAQAAGRRGDYAGAMSAFIQHVASRRGELRGELEEHVREIRSEIAAGGGHKRVPGILADLHFGIEAFVRFSQESGVIDAVAARALLARAKDGLAEAVKAQRSDQADAEPAARFLALLHSALLSGEAHLCGRQGREPENPDAWGWQTASSSGEKGDLRETWLPRGKRVGWIVGDDVYLDLDSAVRAAQAVGTGGGDPVSVSPTTVRRRLLDRGLLKSRDPDGVHFEIQKSFGGVRCRVIHLDVAALTGCEIEEEAVPTPTPSSEAISAPLSQEEPATHFDRPWRCPNCQGSDSWVSRLNGDRKCRSCVSPGPGAEVL